ncbi:CaiB/BaiF CoA transferase family protein [Carboxydothermus pertinax]|uniref:CoA transferase n=1 Tax=Carboxydothermus pertinax TaxID=870242 RepID=A0A1L8CTL7_9THEO|nr:CoA transferase [Carboxydothermus pertinax]GAV22242.1 CoA transferase [Carboxydothermus pertinax]
MRLLADKPLILDLTRLLPGPYGTFLLSAYGARVVKIEDPFSGDYLKAMMSFDGQEAFIYRLLNQNKEKVFLNLKDPVDREKFLAMVKEAKVLVESFRPKVMEKLGVGYYKLKEINPKLIYINLGGYLEGSEDADKAGHDLNYLAQSGILGYTYKDGPVVIGAPIADFAGGLALSSLVMGGLYYQQVTGQGMYLQIGMAELMESWGVLAAAVYGDKKRVPGPGEGLLNGGVVCYNVYRAKDGYLSLGALEEKFWVNFLKAINREDLKPGQFTPAVKGNRYYEEICAFFAGITVEEALNLFKDADCCLKPVKGLKDVAVESLEEGQKKVLGFFVQK